MAYQHTHSAHAADLLHHVAHGVKIAFAAVGGFFVSIASANRRMVLVEKLQAKSDTELAAMGLRREDIVRHVFKDMLDA